MKIKLYTCLLLCFVATNMSAQKTKLKPVFHSYNTFQLLHGSTTTSVAVTSVNGFSFNKFFAGLGVGVDEYREHTIPVFVEARYGLLKEERLEPFVNIGMQIPFDVYGIDENPKSSEAKKGLCYGIGFDYLLLKSKRLVTGIGYSYKEVVSMVSAYYTDPFGMPLLYQSQEKYKLNRFAVRIGWRF